MQIEMLCNLLSELLNILVLCVYYYIKIQFYLCIVHCVFVCFCAYVEVFYQNLLEGDSNHYIFSPIVKTV